MTCKRNAFVFLANCSMQKAVEYLLSVYDQIPSLDELMQMAVIELIRKDCANDSVHRVSCSQSWFDRDAYSTLRSQSTFDAYSNS